ncbi:MAG: hypothetical protein Q7R52_03265 [archaeon]|nr:hypothetical protein [archaeon]
MPKKTSAEDKENFLRIFGDKHHFYNIRRSCKEAGIGKSTFYRWLQNSEFKKEIKKIKAKRNRDTMKAMKSGHITEVFKMLRGIRTLRRLRC